MATVLVVEDDPQIRTAYSFVLAKQHEVIEAKDGEEALDCLRKREPDIMLLDMLMPGLSGLDLLRQASIKQHFPTLKIIGFSNIDNPKIVAEAVALGVDKYVLKVDTTPHGMADLIAQMLASETNENTQNIDSNVT